MRWQIWALVGALFVSGTVATLHQVRASPSGSHLNDGNARAAELQGTPIVCVGISLRITLQAEISPGDSDALLAILRVVGRRAARFDYVFENARARSEPMIVGPDRIEIVLDNVENELLALSIISDTGYLELLDTFEGSPVPGGRVVTDNDATPVSRSIASTPTPQGVVFTSVIDSRHVDDAYFTRAIGGGGLLNIVLNEDGASRLTRYAGANDASLRLAIDKIAYGGAVAVSEVGDTVSVAGIDTTDIARFIVELRSGVMPAPLHVILSEPIVNPSCG